MLAQTGTVPSSKIPARMTALRKLKPERGLVLQETAVPQPGPTDVLIKVRKAGICGTDGHIFGWDAWAQRRIHPPLTVGHEFMGTVAAAGEAVRGIVPGDRVSAEGHISCGACLLCRTGEAHICEHVEIPDDFGAIFDPLGNAVHTVMAAGVSAKSVVITGVGSIGLMAIPVARAAGAARVFAVDVNAEKLALAERVGADAVFDARDPNLVDEILRRTGGDGADVLLEMSGSASAIDSGLQLLRNGGRAALLGIPPDDVKINLAERIIFKGLTVLGINGRKMFETWYQTQALVKSGRVDLRPIITHRLPLEQYAEGFELMRSGKAAKIVFDVEGA
jgi:threonine 3-dehydrogenase